MTPPQSNSSAPDRRRPAAGALTPLPPRAQPGTTKREQRQIFEQVKTQVLAVAVASLEQTLRILKNWMKED